jgi:hypothetical protein
MHGTPVNKGFHVKLIERITTEMAREKVTFEERVQVLLDRDEAKPIASRDGGTEYMRVLDHDKRIMFCPPALEAAIKASGAKAGDLISIDQLTTGTGRSARTHWDVAIISDPEPAAPARRAGAATVPAAAPGRPAAAQPAAPPADRDTAAQAAAMASAFRAAILATGDAEQHAAAMGIRDLVLSDAETITRVALSIYIQGARQ